VKGTKETLVSGKVKSIVSKFNRHLLQADNSVASKRNDSTNPGSTLLVPSKQKPYQLFQESYLNL
jgi:hypothetical protein